MGNNSKPTKALVVWFVITMFLFAIFMVFMMIGAALAHEKRGK